MQFNSIEFSLFLPIVFSLYWIGAKSHLKIENVILLVASYVFYGWWDWRFLSLIIFSSFIDYFVGLRLSKASNLKKRKILLLTSIILNLGFLGVFKYYNFFIESFSQAFTLMGNTFDVPTLNIILPVGISFYTFQTLSYSIDIYKRKLEPTKDIVAFFAFVSFFPQLVAGPIERAHNLLPQFLSKRIFLYSKAVEGMRQLLWGLFKKIVIADNCAEYANLIFNNYSDYSGSTLALGALFFTFQIYCDFSGYSDIAIGTSRLFGFDLKRNFAFPYFSRDIAEFWRRWHISLSTWFRDYLYIPLGGSRGGISMKIRNIFIIFIVSGFWHGANWTFVFWGALNAIYFLPLLLLNRNRQNLGTIAEGHYFPNIRDFFGMVSTFSLTVLAWIFFRADSLPHAFHYISIIFSKSFFTIPDFLGKRHALQTAILVLVFVLFEWIGREEHYATERFGEKWSRLYRWTFYLALCLSISFFGSFSESIEFIYFQF